MMYDNESIVYGLIQDVAPAEEDRRERLMHNRDVIARLPDHLGSPIIARDMFSLPAAESLGFSYMSQVIHFGASYRALEYEWDAWMNAFETVLRQLYWVNATVHLRTELAGNHAFHWSSAGSHRPNADFNMRCEWDSEKFVRSSH